MSEKSFSEEVNRFDKIITQYKNRRLFLTIELEQIKSCKSGYLNNIDKAIKVETRIKNNLIRNKSFDSEIESIPHYEKRIKGVIASTKDPKSPGHGFKVIKQPEIPFQETPKHSSIRSQNTFDYKYISDIQKDEINMLLDKEKNYKLEVEHLRRQIDELKKRQGGFCIDKNSELKSDGFMMKEKEIAELNRKLNSVEYEKENLMVKFIEFIKRTSKYFRDECVYSEILNTTDIDRYLYNVEGLIEKLITERIERNNNFGADKIEKIVHLNSKLDELKTENSKLK
jgi:hypothetical protein